MSNDHGITIITPGQTPSGTARAALSHAKTTTCFNITARENDLFDLLFEYAAPRAERGDHGLGRGLGQRMRNWHDFQLDHPRLRRR